MEVRIGLLTDAMPDRSLSDVATWACGTGLIQDLEIGVGGYSSAPHCRPAELLAHTEALASWRRTIDDAGLGISALNVSGNPLHPNPEIAARHDADLRQAIRLAAELGVDDQALDVWIGLSQRGDLRRCEWRFLLLAT